MCKNKENEYNPSIRARNLKVFYKMTDTVRAPNVDSLHFCSATCLANYYKESVVAKIIHHDFRFQHLNPKKFVSDSDREYLEYVHNKVSATMWVKNELAGPYNKEAEDRFFTFLERMISRGIITDEVHPSQMGVFTKKELEDYDLSNWSEIKPNPAQEEPLQHSYLEVTKSNWNEMDD